MHINTTIALKAQQQNLCVAVSDERRMSPGKPSSAMNMAANLPSKGISNQNISITQIGKKGADIE